MAASAHHDDRFTPDDRAAIAGLADGSLDPAAAPAARQRAEADADLRMALTAQERAVTLLRATPVSTPPWLRDRLADQRSAAPALGRPRAVLRLAPQALRTPAGAAVGVVALVVIAVVVALGLSGGGSSGPTVAQAAAAGSLGPDAPAPRAAREHTLLDLQVQGVAFPSLRRRFGWRAIGTRTQPISGRFARSVFYSKGPSTIAYTVLAAPQLDWPSGSARTVREGVELHTLTTGGRVVVTWRRLGHTCVLSGTGVTAAVLIQLAVWRGGGAVRF